MERKYFIVTQYVLSDGTSEHRYHTINSAKSQKERSLSPSQFACSSLIDGYVVCLLLPYLRRVPREIAEQRMPFIERETAGAVQHFQPS